MLRAGWPPTPRPRRTRSPPRRGLLLGTTGAAMLVGALVGAALGGWEIGLLVGALVGIPLAVAVVYWVYSR